MIFDTEWEHEEIRKETAAMKQATLNRGRELRAMSDEEFLALWEDFRQLTPNELNAAEPFYVVIAIERLRKHVKG
jgi:hypothetical protein